MNKRADPVEAHARTLALRVRRAEECVAKSMTDFLTAQDKRSRRRALIRIRMHEETKGGLLELALRLPEGEALQFLKHYTTNRIDTQGAKLASFADRLLKEAKSADSHIAKTIWVQLAICQEWEESERAWGKRSDGFSLHFTREECKKFIEAYWASMPKSIPDEYSRPRGEPYAVRVPEKSKWHLDLIANESKLGVRYYESEARPEKV